MIRQIQGERMPIWWAAALIVLTAVLYHDTLTHEFSYDDYGVISRNESVRDLSNLRAIFSPERYFYISGESTYRPVVTIFYFLEAAVFGIEPEGFHFVSVLFHALCGILTAWLGLRLGLPRFQAGFAAALFLAHPVATEAVNSVGFFEDVLALLFMQISLVCVLTGRPAGPGRIAASTACYLAALFSKEVAILFPVAVLGVLWKEGWRPRDLVKIGCVLGAALAGYIGVRFVIFHPPFEPVFVEVARMKLETLFSMLTVAVNYIRLFFVPIGLSASHVVPLHPELTWDVLLAFGVLAGFGILVWRSPLFCVRWGGIWCLLFFLPVLQIAPTAQISAERFMYVPLFGASLALSAAWDRQFSFSKFWNRWVPCAVLLALSILTLQRNPIWRTHETVFLDALRKHPDGNVTALGAMGLWAFERGQYDLSESYYAKALVEDPVNNPIANRLATIYYLTGRYADAIRILKEVVSRNPEDSHAHLMMAWSLWMSGDPAGARQYGERADASGLRTPEERRALEDLRQKMKKSN